MTPLGNHIIRRRKKKGWKRADLAREADIPYTTLRNIETGVSKKPQEEVLRTISRTIESDEGVVLALAGYGEIPHRTQEELTVSLDEFGESAPMWKDVLEKAKHRMTPEDQERVLTVLRAQVAASHRQ